MTAEDCDRPALSLSLSLRKSPPEDSATKTDRVVSPLIADAARAAPYGRTEVARDVRRRLVALGAGGAPHLIRRLETIDWDDDEAWTEEGLVMRALIAIGIRSAQPS